MTEKFVLVRFSVVQNNVTFKCDCLLLAKYTLVIAISGPYVPKHNSDFSSK